VTGASSLWDLLFAALALVLVIEGVLPFFNPGLWRQVFERVLRMTDGQIRFAGLSSMLVGVVLLWLCWS
jgi:uncharacterized protein YjeT (DUF2065 family)